MAKAVTARGSDRFLVWPEQGERGTWYCGGCCKGGDAIEFLRVFDGLSFADACARVGVRREEYQRKDAFGCKSWSKLRNVEQLALPQTKGPVFTPRAHAAPAALWQQKAGELLAYAQRQLLGNAPELERLARRGLPREAGEHFGLGLLPGEKITLTSRSKAFVFYQKHVLAVI